VAKFPEPPDLAAIPPISIVLPSWHEITSALTDAADDLVCTLGGRKTED
jgi:hypothetical protein